MYILIKVAGCDMRFHAHLKPVINIVCKKDSNILLTVRH